MSEYIISVVCYALQWSLFLVDPLYRSWASFSPFSFFLSVWSVTVSGDGMLWYRLRWLYDVHIRSVLIRLNNIFHFLPAPKCLVLHCTEKYSIMLSLPLSVPSFRHYLHGDLPPVYPCIDSSGKENINTGRKQTQKFRKLRFGIQLRKGSNLNASLSLTF